MEVSAHRVGLRQTPHLIRNLPPSASTSAGKEMPSGDVTGEKKSVADGSACECLGRGRGTTSTHTLTPVPPGPGTKRIPPEGHRCRSIQGAPARRCRSPRSGRGSFLWSFGHPEASTADSARPLLVQGTRTLSALPGRQIPWRGDRSPEDKQETHSPVRSSLPLPLTSCEEHPLGPATPRTHSGCPAAFAHGLIQTHSLQPVSSPPAP